MAEIAKQERAAGRIKSEIDVATTIDTSFVDELERSGFIARLYAK